MSCPDYFLPIFVSFILILVSGIFGYIIQPRAKKITIVILIQLSMCVFLMLIFSFLLEWLGSMEVL